MAFDWSKVDGYKDDMTAEEKLALLESYEPDASNANNNDPAPKEPEPAPSKPMGAVISKKRFDEVAAELARVKKELKGRMTADEADEMERQAKVTEMETELNELRREKLIATYRASYLEQGYDAKMAEDAANAKVDGDSATEFAIMKKFNEAQEKALRAKILKETGVPPASDTPPKESEDDKVINAMRRAMGLPPNKK